MQITTIMGSPRPKGNTATVLKKFEDGLNGRHTLARINITDHEIHGCLGCYQCQAKRHEPGCVQKDDVPELIDKMLQADALVLATPLYGWSFSGQLKLFLDRQFCLTKFGDPDRPPHSLVAGKTMALLVTCGGGVEENADLIQTLFDRFNTAAQTRSAGSYIVPGCTSPDQLPTNAEAIAKEMAAVVTRA